MTQSLANIRLIAAIEATLQLDIDGGEKTASVGQGFQITPATALTTGTSANQADRIWSFGEDDHPRTLASGTSEDLDLFDLGTINIGAGAGRDGLGQAQTFAEIVGILLHVDPDSEGTMLVGGNGTAAAFNAIFAGDDDAQLGPFGPDGLVLLSNHGSNPAWAVADTSNHLLRITEASSAGDLTYRAIVLARSA